MPRRTERSDKPSGDGSASKSAAPRTSTLAPGLYVVATPIGNLGDMTARAKDVLAAADVIACEDTRVTGGLLNRFAIVTPMTPYHDHNAERVRPVLIERLKSGGCVALVSDAGTPLISDPGFKLVAECAAEGITVIPVPGASAMLAALVTAALPTDRVLFAGFLPAKAGARESALQELKGLRATLVFYESAQRLPDTLPAMAETLGPRAAAVCRELTKLHEEIRRDTLDKLAAHYISAGAPKGEVVIVVAGAGEEAAPQDADVDAAIADALKSMSLRDAVDAVAEALRLPRRTVYARALELAKTHPVK